MCVDENITTTTITTYIFLKDINLNVWYLQTSYDSCMHACSMVPMTGIYFCDVKRRRVGVHLCFFKFQENNNMREQIVKITSLLAQVSLFWYSGTIPSKRVLHICFCNLGLRNIWHDNDLWVVSEWWRKNLVQGINKLKQFSSQQKITGSTERLKT